MTAPSWRGVGAALGPFDTSHVVLLASDSPVALAAAARGVADAVGSTRRVAVFDLASAFGTDARDGLLRAFREGRSLNTLAQPISDGTTSHFVVRRGPGALDAQLSEHERWPRLIHGFRSTGALLIILTPASYVGTGVLARFADRAFVLGSDGAIRAIAPVEAPRDAPQDAPGDSPGELRGQSGGDTRRDAANAPHDEPPPVAPLDHVPRDSAVEIAAAGNATPAMSDRSGDVAPESGTVGDGLSARGDQFAGRQPAAIRRVVALVILAAVGVAAWAVFRPTSEAPAPTQLPLAAAPDAVQEPMLGDTLEIPAIVNPDDSARASAWGVEFVTTNYRSRANLPPAGQTPLPAATVFPVLLGGDPNVWYKLVAGAYVDRSAAELLRSTLRSAGLLEGDAGVVVRVPLALRVEAGMSDEGARARAAELNARGLGAYALQGDSTGAAVYVGAFRTPDQSAVLAAVLRAAGLQPVLAYRVGRTY